MSVSEVDQSKLEVLRQHITELEAKNVNTKAEKADIEDMYMELLEAIREEYTRRDAEKAEFKARIEELEKIRTDTVSKNVELGARVVKLEQDIDELKKELESKKHRKFQEKCILIAQVLLGEEPIVEYRPSLRGLEVQGAQHWLHNTSWYKDVKKLEDIVNRDRKKRTLCQLNGIYLLEVWYDENPEITIPKKIYKFKECIGRKHFNLD